MTRKDCLCQGDSGTGIHGQGGSRRVETRLMEEEESQVNETGKGQCRADELQQWEW